MDHLPPVKCVLYTRGRRDLLKWNFAPKERVFRKVRWFHKLSWSTEPSHQHPCPWCQVSPRDQRLGLTLSGAAGAAPSQSVRVGSGPSARWPRGEGWAGRKCSASWGGSTVQDGASGDGLSHPISNPVRRWHAVGGGPRVKDPLSLRGLNLGA